VANCARPPCTIRHTSITNAEPGPTAATLTTHTRQRCSVTPPLTQGGAQAHPPAGRSAQRTPAVRLTSAVKRKCVGGPAGSARCIETVPAIGTSRPPACM
jgi:hypothetical protein